MASKRIQLSSDDTTYYTLPGNTGSISDEMGTLNDTIFGQSFTSTEAGLISWSVSSNALFKGLAGYTVLIRKGGSATGLTDEPMSLVSGKRYRITDATKRVLDTETAIVVEDNGTAVDAEDIESINYLTGEVVFASGYAVNGPVTLASGNYIPLAEVAGSRDWTLTMSLSVVDDTDIPTARANGGVRTVDPSQGLITVGLELGTVFKTANAFRAALMSRDPLYIDISPDAGATAARGIFKYTGREQSGDVGALEEESITLELNVPFTDGVAWEVPFTWIYNSSTLSQAVQIAIAALLNKTGLYMKYLPDGTNGVTGACAVSEISLTGGLDAMNEFSITLTGDGALTATP